MVKSMMKYGYLFSIILFLFGCQEEPSKGEDPQDISAVKSRTLFQEVSSKQSGIDFNNAIVPTHRENPMTFDYIFNGAGVAAGDVNGDDLPDLYFTGNQVADKLYINKGDLKFEDVTSVAGIQSDENWTNGVNMVDINGDGFLDIYVCRGGKFSNRSQRANYLYINDGNGKFSEQAKAFGLDDSGYSTQSYFFDADQDGDLDALILNRPNKWPFTVAELNLYKEDMTSDEQDHFYINENGSFKNISYAAGFKENYGFSLSASLEDLNNDGLIDIYIANDYLQNDYFYKNLGGGKFEESIRELTNHTPFYAMGSDFRDLNNDGYSDGVVVEMLPKDYKRAKTTMIPMMDAREFESVFGNQLHHQYMHNAVYHNNQNGFLTDIAQYTGLTSTDWSWAVIAEDLDNDGWKDVFITNGYRYDANDRDAFAEFAAGYKAAIDVNKVDVSGKSVQELYKPENLIDNPPNPVDLLRPLPSVPIKNFAFQNKGEYEFENIGSQWGLDKKGFSNGAAIADLDGDGDLDMVINNIDEPAWLFQNTQNDDNFIRFKLSGSEGNILGLGAQIELQTDNGLMVNRLTPARGYLSSSEYICHFGLGERKVTKATVKWPNGQVQELTDLKRGSVHVVDYNPGERLNPKEEEATLLVETTHRRMKKKFVHQEDYFFDYENQVLIPHKFSQEGPTVVVGDVDQDGLEDIFVGGAAGFSGALFYQTKNGDFVERTPSIIRADQRYEDGGADFLDIDGDGDLDLYVASGSNQFDLNDTYYIDRIYLNEGGKYTGKYKMPLTNINGAVVDARDIDGDKISEVFVGGGAMYDAYPYPNTSMLYKVFPDQGLIDVSESVAEDLKYVGLARDGQFVDLDGVPPYELVLTGEWMPIKVLGFENGGFIDKTAVYGFENMTGWWFNLTFADIDGDGDQDIIAGNLGENYKFHASENKSFKVFADDFDQNGTYDVFLAKKLDNDRLVPIRGKDCTSEQMPGIAARFPTFNEFADADVDEIIGTKTDRTIEFEAKTFTSYIFENTGPNQKMKAHRLPKEAQWSTLRAAQVDDFNDDGKLDILIGGNMFPVEPETTRADGSPGYVLINQGGWKFQALTPRESGFFIPDDVRSIEPINIGGKKAFIVASNKGPLRFFEKR